MYASGTDPTRSPTRYDNVYLNLSDSSSRAHKPYVDGSRTEGSSAYHHGYRMRNDGRDENETYQDDKYAEGDGHYRGGGGGGTYQEETETYRELEGYEYRYEKYHGHHGGPRSHYNNYNIQSKNSNSNRQSRHLRHPQSPTSGYATQDSLDERESRASGTRDGISTVADDIRPAETDMAYNGSEEEGEESRDEDNSKYRDRFEEERSIQQNERYYSNERETAGSNYRYGLTEEEMRQSKLLLATTSEKDVPSKSSSKAKSLRKPSVEEPEVHERPLVDDTDSVDSFSTLTKTLATTVVVEDPAVIKKENERNLKKIKEAAVGSFDQMSTPAVEESEEAEVVEAVETEKTSTPPEKKLEELLLQQQLQEEKLQKQLEQLRIQKEKLQLLQEEKMRGPPKDGSDKVMEGVPHSPRDGLVSPRDGLVSPRDGGDNTIEGVQHSLRQGLVSPRDGDKTVESVQQCSSPPDWTLPEIKKPPIQSRQSSKKSSVDSRTRRQRLEKARQKVMPMSPTSRKSQNEEVSMPSSKEARSLEKFVDEWGVQTPANQESEALRAFKTLEEKYAGREEASGIESSTGTATGEVEGSVPEFDDVPSSCQINKDGPGPFQENDLTTISASLATNEFDHTTVSSIKDGHGRHRDRDHEDLAPLPEATSSIDEEIDLDFVAKYDKAFNAFLDKYPALFDRNSQLIQNLKVAKLQRILEVSYRTECDLESQLETPSETKTNIEAEFQKKLKEASRQKAERSIQLRADLNHIKKQSRIMQGTLTWDMLQLSIKRAIKLNKIKTEIEKKDIASHEDLLAAMPDGPVMDELKKAMRESPSDTFGPKQKKEIQQLKVDNAFLSSEVKVLNEKIETLKAEAKKQEWVDSTLLQMDAKKLKKLKARYQKKIGVSF